MEMGIPMLMVMTTAFNEFFRPVKYAALLRPPENKFWKLLQVTCSGKRLLFGKNSAACGVMAMINVHTKGPIVNSK